MAQTRASTKSGSSSRAGREARLALLLPFSLVLFLLCTAQTPDVVPDASTSSDAEAIAPVGPPPPGFQAVKPDTPWGPQMMWQRSKAEAHKKRAESQAKDVEILKSQIIQRRFDDLDDTAAAKNWEGKPPRQDSRDWEAYQEWKFLKEHLEALKDGKRPKRSAPQDYRPKWLSE